MNPEIIHMLEHLKHKMDSDEEVECLGICGYIFHICYETKTGTPSERVAWVNRLMDLMEDWPGHSGNRKFPVPYKNGDHRFPFITVGFPVHVFWDTTGEYGKARYNLLLHLIQKAKETNIPPP